MMMGFVSAISASLAVIVLITVSALLGFISSIMPQHGIKRVDDYQYILVLKYEFISEKGLQELSDHVANIELENQMKLKSVKPLCNYGFDRPEREMQEIVTFNFLILEKYYLTGDVVVKNSLASSYNQGVNYCSVYIEFEPAN
jgi:hypothetical protein